MSDPIIKELWDIKDAIAREHGYDIDALIAHLEAHRGENVREPGDRIADKQAAGQPHAGDKAVDA